MVHPIKSLGYVQEEQSEKFVDLGTLTRPHSTSLRAHNAVRHARSVYLHTSAPAKVVSPTMNFWAFVAQAPHLTILRQSVLSYGGKVLLPSGAAKILKAKSQNRHNGFSFLNE